MKKALIIITAVAALGVGGATLAGATTGGEGGGLEGATLERASEAALAETGSGKVTDSEREGETYEVEVTKDDGSEVDVQLDRGFDVVSSATDREDGD